MKTISLFILFISMFSNAQENKQKDVFDAARYGTVEEMKALETKNPDTINAVNKMEFTPLILSCYK